MTDSPAAQDQDQAQATASSSVAKTQVASKQEPRPSGGFGDGEDGGSDSERDSRPGERVEDDHMNNGDLIQTGQKKVRKSENVQDIGLENLNQDLMMPEAEHEPGPDEEEKKPNAYS